jgi:hypothetical protein
VHCIIHFALEVMSCTYGHDCTGIASWMQLRTLLGMQAEAYCICIHVHLKYCWKRYIIVVSIGSLFTIHSSILGFIQKYSYMLNHCLIELVV